MQKQQFLGVSAPWRVRDLLRTPEAPAAPAPVPVAPVEPAAPAAPVAGEPPPAAVPAPVAPPVAAEPPAPAPVGTPPAAAPVVPDTYALTAPDGSLLEQADLDQVAAIAKAEQLTQEDAQARVDAYAAALQAQRERYRTETAADPVLGGAHLEATNLAAKRALDFYAPESTQEGRDTRAFLEKTGLGNQRLVVGLFARLGKDLAEDTTHAPGGPPAPQPTSADHRLGSSLIPKKEPAS